MNATILVVDDDLVDRSLLVRVLQEEGYATVAASNGREALELAHREPIYLVILDAAMPVMDGFETCRCLKEDERTARIPVTMLTWPDDREDRMRGIEAGADNFLGKPFDRAMLRARLRTQLRFKRTTDQLERTEAVIFTMARWVELKDQYTEAHVRRVAGYSERVASALGLGAEHQMIVRFAGILHDIGKIGVPDAILAKPGKLSLEEQAMLQRHPDYGAEIIAPMRFAATVAPIIRAHHEWWDGRGYPRGLSGDEIPIGARIISVADAWDAMITDRPYRRALDMAEAVRRVREGSGSQWDPRVVETFLTLLDADQLAPIDLPGCEPVTA